jgi:hypothetical protein
MSTQPNTVLLSPSLVSQKFSHYPLSYSIPTPSFFYPTMPRTTRPQNANAHPGLVDAPKPRRAKAVIEAEKQAKVSKQLAQQEAARNLVEHEKIMKATQEAAKEGAHRLPPPSIAKVAHKASPVAKKARREAPPVTDQSDVDNEMGQSCYNICV